MFIWSSYQLCLPTSSRMAAKAPHGIRKKCSAPPRVQAWTLSRRSLCKRVVSAWGENIDRECRGGGGSGERAVNDYQLQLGQTVFPQCIYLWTSPWKNLNPPRCTQQTGFKSSQTAVFFKMSPVLVLWSRKLSYIFKCQDRHRLFVWRQQQHSLVWVFDVTWCGTSTVTIYTGHTTEELRRGRGCRVLLRPLTCVLSVRQAVHNSWECYFVALSCVSSNLGLEGWRAGGLLGQPWWPCSFRSLL